MNVFIKALVAVAILAAIILGATYYYVFHAGDSEPLEQFIPADSLAYIEISNTRQTALDLALNPHREALYESSRIMAGIAASALSGLDEIDLSQIDTEALARLALPFNRQVAAWMPKVDWDAEKPKLGLPVMIAHLQSDARSFEKDLAAVTESLKRAASGIAKEEDFKWTNSEHQGLTIRTLNTGAKSEIPDAPIEVDALSPSWTIWEDRLVASFSEASLKGYLNTLVSGTISKPLSEDPKYSKVDGNDLIATFNFGSLIEGLQKAQSLTGSTALSADLSVDEILEVSGILEFNTITYALDISSDTFTSYSSVDYDEDKGIISLIKQGGHSPVPTFIPESAESTTSLSMDFGELVLLIRDIALAVSPEQKANFDRFNLMANQFLGMDAESFLRDVFGSEFHLLYDFGVVEPTLQPNPLQNPITGMDSQVLALGLDNAQPLKDVVGNFLLPLLSGQPGALQEREAAGTRYHVIGNPGMPNAPEVSFVILDNYALIGVATNSDSKMFAQTLDHIASGKPGLLQQPNFQTAFDPNNPNLVGSSVIDMGKYMDFLKSVAGLVSAQSRASGELSIANAIDSVNWSAFDSLKVYAATETLKTENELISISRIIEK